MSGLKSVKTFGFLLSSFVLIAVWWFLSPTHNQFKSEMPLPADKILEVRPLKLSKNLTPVSPSEKESAPASQNEAAKESNRLTNLEIEEVFQNFQRQFQNCWIQRLKDKPNLKGKVSFRVTISPRGKISDTQLAQADMDDALMLQCLNSTLKRISFREFRGDPIEVLFPLEFEF